MRAFLYIVVFSLFCFSANGLVINEIMYNPDGGDSGHEWIEIYSHNLLNLSGCVFYEEGSNHGLNLVEGSWIVEGYAIIADEADTFLLDYPDFGGTLFDSSWSSLSNNGEYLALKNSSLDVVDEIFYLSEWGNEEGKSLELIDYDLDNNLSSNWNSSLIDGGTPGFENSLFYSDEINPAVELISPENNSLSSFRDNFDEGSYSWNVSCVDDSNNYDSDFRILNVDLTFPELSNLILDFDENNISFSLNFSEFVNLSFNGEIFNLSDSFSFELDSLNYNEFYYYNLSYCDPANNCGFYSGNFSIFQEIIKSLNNGNSGNFGGSSRSDFNPNFNELSYDFGIGLGGEYILYEWSNLNFEVGNEEHSVKIKNILDNGVVLTFSSEPFDVLLKVEDEINLDLNLDGLEDIIVKLISVNEDNVELFISGIEGEEVLEESNSENQGNLITGSVISEIEEPNPRTGILVSLGIVILALIGYFVFRKK